MHCPKALRNHGYGTRSHSPAANHRRGMHASVPVYCSCRSSFAVPPDDRSGIVVGRLHDHSSFGMIAVFRCVHDTYEPQVLSYVSPICNLVGLRYGLGRHADSIAPEKILQYNKVLYVFEVVWTFTVPFVKLSLLLLYNRIFPVRPIRLATCAVGFFVVTWLLWAGIATIAQCIPVEYFWNREIPGHCINNDAFYISAGAVNVFTSFAIIAIPIPIIWRLQKINLTQKIGFTVVFTLGGWYVVLATRFPTIVSNLPGSALSASSAWSILGESPQKTSPVHTTALISRGCSSLTISL